MNDNPSLLEQAITAARQKDFASARNLLRQLLKQEPNNLTAWLLAAHVVETRSDAIGCYKQVLRLDPGHAYAREKLSRLQGEPSAPVPAGPPEDRPDVAGKDSSVVAVKQAVLPRSETSQPQIANRPQVQVPRRKSSNSDITILLWILIGLFCLGALGLGILSTRGQLFKPAAPTPTSQQLFEVLYQNSRAANAENVDAYMATIHSKSPLYRQTKTSLSQIFALYNLEFQFYDLQVISLKANEAQVHFSLSTRKLSGPDFRNNVATGTMILRPDNGVWKIYDQKIEGVQY